jgi:hypothetical protein
VKRNRNSLFAQDRQPQRPKACFNAYKMKEIDTSHNLEKPQLKEQFTLQFSLYEGEGYRHREGVSFRWGKFLLAS